MAFNGDNSVFSPSEQHVSSSLAGRYAVSLAGHDKGRLYVVVGAEADKSGSAVHLLLADGRTRGFSCPKRKKPRHVRVFKARDEGIAAAVLAGASVDGSVLVRSLKSFQASCAYGVSGQDDQQ